jgi:hypothetical protein
VAGFVVGTTFEAALMGWLACLHVNGALDDPPLFGALMALFVIASWSGIFHGVLYQIDVLLELANTHNPKDNDPLVLYGHFNLGLAVGLGLECAILHHILARTSHGHTAALLLSQPRGILGMVSIVFGVGCVGLTLVRSHYRVDKSKRFLQKKKNDKGMNHHHNHHGTHN